jgi:SPP1 family predicted phage head-tail adaptor
MRAGAMRHRVQIQDQSTTLDTFGGQPLTWTTLATIWADIQPLSAREKEASQAINVEVTHEITIRYQAQFNDTKAMAARRLVYGSRLFNIHGILNVDERNKQMTILASEGMNLGN